jgi:hypothetical protein
MCSNENQFINLESLEKSVDVAVMHQGYRLQFAHELFMTHCAKGMELSIIVLCKRHQNCNNNNGQHQFEVLWPRLIVTPSIAMHIIRDRIQMFLIRMGVQRALCEDQHILVSFR